MRPRLVDAHTHLLPDRLAQAIRGYFVQFITGGLLPLSAGGRGLPRSPGGRGCRPLLVPPLRPPRRARASDLNRWMAERWGQDPVVEPGATVHPGDDVAQVVDEALGLGLRLFKVHCAVGEFSLADPRLDPAVGPGLGPADPGGGPPRAFAHRAHRGRRAARPWRRWPGPGRRRRSSSPTSAPRRSRRGWPSSAAAPRSWPTSPRWSSRPRRSPPRDLEGLEERMLFGTDVPSVGPADRGGAGPPPLPGPRRRGPSGPSWQEMPTGWCLRGEPGSPTRASGADDVRPGITVT